MSDFDQIEPRSSVNRHVEGFITRSLRTSDISALRMVSIGTVDRIAPRAVLQTSNLETPDWMVSTFGLETYRDFVYKLNKKASSGHSRKVHLYKLEFTLWS